MTIRKQIGFSLIELIVVMAIIATLIAIALPRYQGSIENSRLTSLKADLRVVRECIDRYYEDKGQYPQTLQELVDARYLKEIPIDPITDSAQTWVLEFDQEGDEDGIVDIASGARGVAIDGVAYSEL